MRSRRDELTLLRSLLISFSLLTAACGINVAGSTGDTVALDGRICEVTDTRGIYDGGFNQETREGIERAGVDFGASADVLESRAVTDFEVNINAFVDEGCDLIVTVGPMLRDATLDGAVAHPGARFAIVDSAFDDPPANLKGLVFNTNEAAFLAGYLAAGMTQTGIVGTFGGANLPGVTSYMDGFARGVAHYNDAKAQDVVVLGWDPEARAGMFQDEIDGGDDDRSLAQAMVDEGADIIMPVAMAESGSDDTGAAELAKELGTFLLIGIEVDQAQVDTPNGSVYLTSVVKRVDESVYAAARHAFNESFTNDPYVGTLANNGVDIASYHDLDEQVPRALKDEVVQLRQDIIDGIVDVSG